MTGAPHGVAVPRGMTTVDRGRFGRMYPDLERGKVSERAIEALADAMVREAGLSNNNHRIPAGYTYLGQFVDHDMTFDPTPTHEHRNDPEPVQNFRTPRFDLDSVYGSGPRDQPYLYEWADEKTRGVKLLVEGDDLPRNSQGRALIGDARNDDNLIVSQLHVLFLRFHNKVVDRLRESEAGLENGALFEKAQTLVRWHYQWLVMNDFLPKIAGDAAADRERESFMDCDEPFMPVEFSCAAYRFGHSLIRESYQLNDESGVLPLFVPDGQGGQHLGGFRKLPEGLTIDWARFFPMPGKPTPTRSMCIDARLAKPLSRLPHKGGTLARLNLERGCEVKLPAGATVAKKMGVGPLAEPQLGLERVRDDKLRAELRDATPLWYYVLCEAEALGSRGERLGPVGGEIVAAVLWALLKADRSSYWRESPDWKPTLFPTGGPDPTMSDFVQFTQSEE